jgi:hypothetical protein
MARGDLKTFDYYPYNAGLKLYNNSTDSFKYALLTDTYVSVGKATVDPTTASFTEVAAGGNYSSGGNALAGVAWTIGVVSAGVTALDFTDIALTKQASSPTTGKTMLIVNSTAGNRSYHVIDLTSDGTTAIDLVNNDLAVAFAANGTVNITVTA